MRRHLILGTVLTVCASAAPALIATGSAAAPAPQTCSPVSTKPVHAGNVPSPQRVLGFRWAPARRPTRRSGRTCPRSTGPATKSSPARIAHSWQDRPLRYALVGSAHTMRPLPQVQRNLAAIRDPGTSAARAADLIRSTPDVLWITANVHGNEPSGGDAVLQLLYDLADRSDCVVRTILANSLVGLIPTQNPDGRAANTRTNSYAFDMNRDWFARTQPETSGKLDLLWKYPPQLYVDEHEMGGDELLLPAGLPTRSTTRRRTRPTTRSRTCTAMRTRRRSRPRDIRFETYKSGYDLFYQGYGDTVPTTRVRRCGHDLRAGRRGLVLGAGPAPLHERPGLAVHRSAAPDPRAYRLARHLRPGAERGAAVPAGEERHLQSGTPSAAAGARHPGVRLLPARPAAARPAWSCAGCNWRTCRSSG